VRSAEAFGFRKPCQVAYRVRRLDRIRDVLLSAFYACHRRQAEESV
jgi:hypothetical protein